ncbi:RING-H2 finger protein [Melia azedarach]|uniref:RING-H2 finger protein n=2 Tax=Melia azedarach TaxID=155640 RepID=A0ACC1XVU4_MELAZ|nr:RING-H2 finger protein [Melia azedarach]KAJ4715400.1 RING-H2 finger protein [Melia azedarach]
MSSTSSSSSSQHFQVSLGKFHSRKLLIDNPLNQPTTTAVPPPYATESSLDKDVLLVLSVLVCSVVFTVVLNYLIRCALNRLRLLISSDSSGNSTVRESINKGIKREALKTFPVVKYSADWKLPGLDSECVICLSEFSAGARVRILPSCNHGFHVRCIDKWLKSNASCPKCRHCLVETCEKIEEGSKQASSSSGNSMPVPETVISIRPLEPEGITRNCGGLS